MITALLAFLGSAAARIGVAKVFEILERWQDAKDERALLDLQGRLEAEKHTRTMEAIRVQAELGVKMIEVQAQREHAAAEDLAFIEGVRATQQKSGIVLVDAWNGIIRPLLATICIGLWVASLIERGWRLDDWDRALMAATLGVFVGGRIAATGR